MAAELFDAGGQTDMTNVIVVFRNSANAPKSENRHSRLAKDSGSFKSPHPICTDKALMVHLQARLAIRVRFCSGREVGEELFKLVTT